jgi:hypothetical protein
MAQRWAKAMSECSSALRAHRLASALEPKRDQIRANGCWQVIGSLEFGDSSSARNPATTVLVRSSAAFRYHSIVGPALLARFTQIKGAERRCDTPRA